jgi:hypothetical protein
MTLRAKLLTGFLTISVLTFLTADDARNKTAADAYTAGMGEMKRALATYSATLSGEQDKAVFNRLSTAWETYAPFAKQVIGLGLLNKNQDLNKNQEATQSFKTPQMTKARTELGASVEALVIFNMNAVKRINADNSRLAATAAIMMPIAIVAAIEAARAGEAGKDFAVVAAEGTKVIIYQIVPDMNEPRSKLRGIVRSAIKRTASLVQDIVAASKEQDPGADQINAALMQLDKVVQQNAAASEELASTAEELSGQAAQSLEVVSYFKLSEQEQAIVEHI